MATETDESPSASAESPVRRVLVAGGAFAARGVVAAIGTLAVTDGVLRYLAYANGGVNQPTVSLVSTTLLLTVGFALLLFALSEAVSRGIETSKIARSERGG